jgi:hypothetical protein
MSRRQGLRSSNCWMAGRQTLSAHTAGKSCVRHSIQRTGRISLTGRLRRRQPARAMRRVGARPAFHHPLAVLVFQRILHGHSRGRRRITFSLKMHLRGGFVCMERDRLDAHIHREQIRALGEIRHDTLAYGFLALDVVFATGKQKDARRGCDESRTNHISIIAAARRLSISPG